MLCIERRRRRGGAVSPVSRPRLSMAHRSTMTPSVDTIPRYIIFLFLLFHPTQIEDETPFILLPANMRGECDLLYMI